MERVKHAHRATPWYGSTCIERVEPCRGVAQK